MKLVGKMKSSTAPKPTGRQRQKPKRTQKKISSTKIFSEIAETPAIYLRRVLSQPWEEEEEAKDQIEEAIDDTPVEDAETDEDEDFSEHEDDSSPFEITDEDLDQRKPSERADIIVTLINGQLKVYSGLSDLLLSKPKIRGYIDWAYREALRLRIAVSTAIAQLIVEKNEQFFRGNQHTIDKKFNQRDIVKEQALWLLLKHFNRKHKNEYLSRLINTCEIRKPNGQTVSMANPFVGAPPMRKKLRTLNAPLKYVIKPVITQILKERPHLTDMAIAEESINMLPKPQSREIRQSYSLDSIRVMVNRIRRELNIPNSWRCKKSINDNIMEEV